MGIVSDQQGQQLNGYVDDMIRRAEAPPPTLAQFNGNAQAYDQALRAYAANPLVSQIAAARQEDRQQGGTGAIYNLRLAQIRERASVGIRDGAPDPGMSQQTQGAIMQSVMQGDWLGVIKNVLMSIPIVGDALAAMGKSVLSILKPEKLNPFQAYDRIKVENAAKAAAANLGITDPSAVQSFVNGAIDSTRPPQQPQQPQQPQVAGAPPAANSNQPGVMPTTVAVAPVPGVTQDPTFNAPNGVTPTGGPGTTPGGAAPSPITFGNLS